MKRRKINPIAKSYPGAWPVSLCTPPPTSSALCTFLRRDCEADRDGPGQTTPDLGAMRLQPLLQTVLWAVLLSSSARGWPPPFGLLELQ